MAVLTRSATPRLDDESYRVEGIARREALSAVLSAALLAACSREMPADQGPSTRTVETTQGAVRIPIRPQRIVSVSVQGPTEILDELGAPMIATQHRSDGV